jgi:hypothetical protein
LGHLKEIEMIVKGKNITKVVRKEFHERTADYQAGTEKDLYPWKKQQQINPVNPIWHKELQICESTNRMYYLSD